MCFFILTFPDPCLVDSQASIDRRELLKEALEKWIQYKSCIHVNKGVKKQTRKNDYQEQKQKVKMYLEQLDGKGNILGTADLAARMHAQLGVTNI